MVLMVFKCFSLVCESRLLALLCTMNHAGLAAYAESAVTVTCRQGSKDKECVNVFFSSSPLQMRS